jgi:hypothetical protein
MSGNTIKEGKPRRDLELSSAERDQITALNADKDVLSVPVDAFLLRDIQERNRKKMRELVSVFE